MKILFFLLVLFFNSCVLSKIEKTEIIEVKFGSGGGVNGQVKSYRLLPSGKIYENEIFLKKINSKKVLMLYNQAKKVNMLKYFKPDNVNLFIEIKTNAKTNRIVWAYGSTTIDNDVIILYSTLLTIIK